MTMPNSPLQMPAPCGSSHGLYADLIGFIAELKKLFDPYRPELHYMRGPGPKWQAKHAVSHQ